MLAGPALLSLALAAGPAVLMVPGTPASRVICEDLVEPLSNAGARVKLAGERSDALKCVAKKGAARAACLAEAQAKAKVEGALVVSAVARGAQLTVTLAPVGRAGEALKAETFKTARARLAQAARGPLDRVLGALRGGGGLAASQLLPRLEPRPEAPPPVPVAVAPPAVAPVPAPAAAPTPAPAAAPEPVVADAPRAASPLAPPEVLAPEPVLTARPLPAVKRSAAPGWVLLGAAVVAAGVAGTFAGLGFSDRARLAQAPGGVSSLSYTQAVALRDQANLELSVALGTGIGAAALGTTAGLVWP